MTSEERWFDLSPMTSSCRAVKRTPQSKTVYQVMADTLVNMNARMEVRGIALERFARDLRLRGQLEEDGVSAVAWQLAEPLSRAVTFKASPQRDQQPHGASRSYARTRCA